MTDHSAGIADPVVAFLRHRDGPADHNERPGPPHNAAIATGAGIHCIEEFTGTTTLETHRAQWEALAACALEPDPALEPFYHLPGLTAFGDNGQTVRTAFVWRIDPQIEGEDRRQLAGVFAYRIAYGPAWLAAGPAGSWIHSYSFLGTPLISRERPHQVLAAFLDWFGRVHAPVYLFRMVPADGPFATVLEQVLDSGTHRRCTFDRYERAVLDVPDRVGEYLKVSVSGRKYRKLRRQRRRLAEAGPLSFSSWQEGQDFSAGLEQFFELEKSGWKGRSGTAMACTDTTRRFMEAAAAGMARSGHLGLWSMALDDRPVAMTLGYRAHGQAWLFKIAYDENYFKLSPGALSVIELMNAAAADPALSRIDACADAGHPMFDYLWRERLAIHDVLVECRPGTSAAAFQAHRIAETMRRAGLKTARRLWRSIVPRARRHERDPAGKT